MKLALFPILVLSFFALYPQLTLFMAKDGWMGSYYVSNYDEVAYSSYVNALINGEPRTNDPYVPLDAVHESLYSVQFIPAYSVALPARMLAISASTAFIFLALIIAAASAVAVYFLIREITSDDLISCVGTLVVLCFGTGAAFQGQLRNWLGQQVLVDYLPFLRRYQPGLGFPLLFVFCLFVLRSLSAEKLKRRLVYSVGAGAIFAVLVFTYFYLWTSAAAWLFCVAPIALIIRRSSISSLAYMFAPIAVIGGVALVPYFLMLQSRSANLDDAQLLSYTHEPILLSPTLILGLLLTAGFAVLKLRNRANTSDSSAIAGLSFALTPVILFNQQVLTGRSLQPAHYEIFVANYMVLIAGVILASILARSSYEARYFQRRFLAYVAAAAVVWGFTEVNWATGRNAIAAEIRDNSVPALQFIDGDSAGMGKRPVVHATNFVTADLIPTVAHACPLWNAHTTSAGGVTLQQNKRLFYQYLYYSGFSDVELAEALDRRKFEVVAAIFGPDRALPDLGHNVNPVTNDEVRKEVQEYSGFIKTFDEISASESELAYVIVPTGGDTNFTNLDRWYTRDGGYNAGMFTVYRVSRKR